MWGIYFNADASELYKSAKGTYIKQGNLVGRYVFNEIQVMCV